MSPMLNKTTVFGLLLWTLLLPFYGYAQTAEEKGLEISQEADRRANGFDDFRADMQMILKNRKDADTFGFFQVLQGDLE